MNARWLLILVVLIAMGGGCAARDRSAKPAAQGLVERPADDTPSMTPAELGQRYRALFAEGTRLASEGQYGLALGAFEQAVALRPESAEALFNLGACHEAVGDPLRAVNIYRRVLELTPDDPDCYANLGTSFIKMYHREKSPVWRKMAREAWQRSLELDPRQNDVRAYLAQTESAVEP